MPASSRHSRSPHVALFLASGVLLLANILAGSRLAQAATPSHLGERGLALHQPQLWWPSELDEADALIATIPTAIRLTTPLALRHPSRASQLRVSAARSALRQLIQAWDKEHGYSSSSAWRRLSAFGRNVYTPGYATPEGLESPEADFATFVEELVAPTQPAAPHAELTLKCRASSKYAFVKRLLPELHDRDERATCLDFSAWIAPEKVDGFELLFASESGIHPASMAGHLMLRIRLKAEDRVLNAENSVDPVLSIVAAMPAGVGIGSMIAGGVTGRFLSVAEEAPLSSIVWKYTVLEDRDIYRYELLVNEEEKRAILAQLFEFQKNTRYSYRFFDQNCAALLAQQLALGFGDDSLADSLGPVEPPSFILSKLSLAKRLRETGPAFYSLRHQFRIARSQRSLAFEGLRAQAADPSALPRWEYLASDEDPVRLDAYRRLATYAQSHPAQAPRIYQILALAQLEEKVLTRDRRMAEAREKAQAKPEEGKGAVPLTGIYSATERELAGLTRQVRMMPEVRAGFRELRKGTDIGGLYLEQEIALRAIGSAHTGVLPLEVGPGYSIVDRKGHLELVISTSLFSQRFGDPSRFGFGDGVALQLLPATVVVSLDGRSLDRWKATLLELRKMPEPSDAESAERFREPLRSVFTGAPLGFGLRVLDFSGDRLRGRSIERHFIRTEVIADLVSSQAFRDYLLLSAGGDWGSLTMSHSDAPDRRWIGAAAKLEGQLSLQPDQATMLQGSAQASPRWTSLKELELDWEARATLSQRLGEVLGTELRMNATLSATGNTREGDGADALRFMVTVEARRW